MMKKFAQAGLLLALVLGVATPVKAGLLIEPVVGFNMNSNLDFNDPLDESYSGGGFGWGGRLGYQNLGFQLGIDYLNSTIDLDDKDFKDDLKLSEWAAFVGFEFPILLRVYAGYIFSASGEIHGAGGNEIDLNTGSGTKFGIGFTGLPFIDINLEYRKGTFDESKSMGIKGEGADYNSYLLSLSLPLVI